MISESSVVMAVCQARLNWRERRRRLSPAASVADFMARMHQVFGDASFVEGLEQPHFYRDRQQLGHQLLWRRRELVRRQFVGLRFARCIHGFAGLRQGQERHDRRVLTGHGFEGHVNELDGVEGSERETVDVISGECLNLGELRAVRELRVKRGDGEAVEAEVGVALSADDFEIGGAVGAGFELLGGGMKDVGVIGAAEAAVGGDDEEQFPTGGVLRARSNGCWMSPPAAARSEARRLICWA